MLGYLLHGMLFQRIDNNTRLKESLNQFCISHLKSQEHGVYLFHYPRKSSPLESNPCVPLNTERLLHSALELSLARIGKREILN